MKLDPSKIDIKAFIKQCDEKEKARVAAMTPEERAQYKEAKRQEEMYQEYLAEKITMTRGQLQQDEDIIEDKYLQALADKQDELDIARIFEEGNRKQAEEAVASRRGLQGAKDKEVAILHKRIKELETQLIQITAERDAARKAYLDLLDQRGK